MSKTREPHEPDAAFGITDVNRVRQVRDRGRYDRGTVYDILDNGLVAHVAFVDHGRPVVIPMTYGRDADRLFLHGARKSRIGTAIVNEPVSIGVTLVDGVVVARSAFESSMNYRAVVIYGYASEIGDADARLHALRCITDHNIPGRWGEIRAPFERELKATFVLEVAIQSASAKVRQGPVIDDCEDFDRDVWAGVIPVVTALGYPVADTSVPQGVPIPRSVLRNRTSYGC